MKRFAAHYLFLPDVGFMKQYVVEITVGGAVRSIVPLKEEVESVEWFPGVIVLLPEADLEIEINNGMVVKNISMFISNISILLKKHPNVLEQNSLCFTEALDRYKKREIALFPFLLYPFDFTSMQLVAGTQHRLLR